MTLDGVTSFSRIKTHEIHVNVCITVKSVGVISLCNGGKLEESEGSNRFFSSFSVCLNRNRSALARELLSNISLFVGRL